MNYYQMVSIYRKRGCNYKPPRRTLKQHLSAIDSYKHQVSKGLRPWYVSISCSDVLNGVFVDIGWFGNRIRIELSKVLGRFSRFAAGEFDETCNLDYIVVYFNDPPNDIESTELDEDVMSSKLPTELVVEVVRLLMVMNKHNDHYASEIFRYYTREEKKKFADWNKKNRKRYHKKRGSHNRWIKEAVLSRLESDLTKTKIPTINFMKFATPLQRYDHGSFTMLRKQNDGT